MVAFKDFFAEWNTSLTTSLPLCALKRARVQAIRRSASSSASSLREVRLSPRDGHAMMSASTSQAQSASGSSLVGEIELTGDALDLPGDGLTLIAYTAEPESRAQEQLDFLTSWAIDDAEGEPQEPVAPRSVDVIGLCPDR